MLTSRHFLLGLFAIAGTAAPQGTVAQSAPAAERPSPKVGEIWKFRSIDLWNNSEVASTQVELLEVQADRLISRSTNSTSGEITTVQHTLDLQPCRSMKNSDKVVCGAAFKFPMRVGDKHSFEGLPWPNGEGYFSESCEVKAYESVKVAAGTYEAFRIECTGTLTRVINGSFSARVDETFWFAPRANRVVMSTYADYRSNGGIYNRRKTELVEHQPK